MRETFLYEAIKNTQDSLHFVDAKLVALIVVMGALAAALTQAVLQPGFKENIPIIIIFIVIGFSCCVLSIIFCIIGLFPTPKYKKRARANEMYKTMWRENIFFIDDPHKPDLEEYIKELPNDEPGLVNVLATELFLISSIRYYKAIFLRISIWFAVVALASVLPLLVKAV